MRIRDVLSDLIGIFALFGLLYAAFMLGLGMGWVQ
jgi:hypothetical protein